jgi:hypothetical protein
VKDWIITAVLFGLCLAVLLVLLIDSTIIFGNGYE